MITIGIDPIIFSIGHFHLRWYSLIVLTAIVVGIWLATREATRKGFKKDDIFDCVMWVILGDLNGPFGFAYTHPDAMVPRLGTIWVQ